MKKRQIQNLNISTLQGLSGEYAGGFVEEGLFVSMDSTNFGNRFLAVGQPYLLGEGRVMRIVAGEARAFINLERWKLAEGMCVVVPANAVFEIEWRSDDLRLQAFSVQELSDGMERGRCFGVLLGAAELHLVDRYFELIWQESQRKPLNMQVVRYLQMALFSRLAELHQAQEMPQRMEKEDRRQMIFRQFMELLREHGTRERNVSFYAKELYLTPNYLGSAVKDASGMTVKQWVNRNLIMQAKLLLKYSDVSVQEISADLAFSTPSFFSKFFKHETGLTPLQFRGGK